MGTWEHGNRGGRIQGNGRDQGSGTQARRTPERPVWRDWHLFGPKPLCPLFVCIRAVPNPSWGLLNNSRVLGCKPLPLPARMCHWVSPCPRVGLFRALRAVPSPETPPLAAEARTALLHSPGPRSHGFCASFVLVRALTSSARRIGHPLIVIIVHIYMVGQSKVPLGLFTRWLRGRLDPPPK